MVFYSLPTLSHLFHELQNKQIAHMHTTSTHTRSLHYTCISSFLTLSSLSPQVSPQQHNKNTLLVVWSKPFILHSDFEKKRMLRNIPTFIVILFPSSNSQTRLFLLFKFRSFCYICFDSVLSSLAVYLYPL